MKGFNRGDPDLEHPLTATSEAPGGGGSWSLRPFRSGHPHEVQVVLNQAGVLFFFSTLRPPGCFAWREKRI